MERKQKLELSAWIKAEHLTAQAIARFQQSIISSSPQSVVIDSFFNEDRLNDIYAEIRQESHWLRQRHTYSELYVDDVSWDAATDKEQFVQRDEWRSERNKKIGLVDEILNFLRSDAFLFYLSKIFAVKLSDVNVENKAINTRLFRLGTNDFIRQHNDGSPSREVCLLFYLNKELTKNMGGELCFTAKEEGVPLEIEPIYNRCVLFKPASKGSDHWVKSLNVTGDVFRYNVTSWYWSE